jgi:hypothetical protein
MKVFNKVETDFPALLEYNNCLEEVYEKENVTICIIHPSLFGGGCHSLSCLAHITVPVIHSFMLLSLFIMSSAVYSIVNKEANAEECKTRIKAYEEAHRTEIVIRQSQRADEERAIQDRIQSEQRESERRRRDNEEDEKTIALNKRKFKQESTEVLLGVRTVMERTSCQKKQCIFWFFLFYCSCFCLIFVLAH